MRGVRAKQLRKHARTAAPFLPRGVAYERHPITDQIRVSDKCERGLYRYYKKLYKKLAQRGVIGG